MQIRACKEDHKEQHCIKNKYTLKCPDEIYVLLVNKKMTNVISF